MLEALAGIGASGPEDVLERQNKFVESRLAVIASGPGTVMRNERLESVISVLSEGPLEDVCDGSFNQLTVSIDGDIVLRIRLSGE